MFWIALSLIIASIVITAGINRRLKSTAKKSPEIAADKVCPVIGLSVILVGVTLMVGYVLVINLGVLGTHLVDAIRVWIG